MTLFSESSPREKPFRECCSFHAPSCTSIASFLFVFLACHHQEDIAYWQLFCYYWYFVCRLACAPWAKQLVAIPLGKVPVVWTCNRLSLPPNGIGIAGTVIIWTWIQSVAIWWLIVPLYIIDTRCHYYSYVFRVGRSPGALFGGNANASFGHLPPNRAFRECCPWNHCSFYSIQLPGCFIGVFYELVYTNNSWCGLYCTLYNGHQLRYKFYLYQPSPYISHSLIPALLERICNKHPITYLPTFMTHCLYKPLIIASWFIPWCSRNCVPQSRLAIFTLGKSNTLSFLSMLPIDMLFIIANHDILCIWFSICVCWQFPFSSFLDKSFIR